jgi:hypothetical protein
VPVTAATSIKTCPEIKSRNMMACAIPAIPRPVVHLSNLNGKVPIPKIKKPGKGLFI